MKTRSDRPRRVGHPSPDDHTRDTAHGDEGANPAPASGAPAPTPSPLLVTALLTAVPLWITELEHQPPDTRAEIAHTLADQLGAHGDALLFGGKQCAPTFNALAKGIALAAFTPGGITCFGYHWCVGSGHHNGVQATSSGPCDDECRREDPDWSPELAAHIAEQLLAMPAKQDRPIETVTTVGDLL